MSKLQAAAARHPLVVDALSAALMCGFLARLTADPDWVWLVALFAPLVWRRRWPVIVYWVLVTVAFAAVNFGASGPALLVVPMFAAYSLARHRPARHLWPAAIVVVPFVAGWVWHDGPVWDALALVAVFAASVLLGANLRTRRAYLAQLEERTRNRERVRLAQEVHDIVAHNLAVMVALADGAMATNQADPQRAMDMMGKVSMTGREALSEIRRLVGLLREDEPGGQPGFGDIDGLIQQVRAAGLRVDVTREGTPGDWAPAVGLAVYRIVQEALTNTMKHAGPQAKAEVRLRYHSGGAEVDVLDDGGTAERQVAKSGGHGLAGMAERAASLGGQVNAGPRPGRGWRVHARLELPT